jgi:glycosyltransferase involved in cell wall biosynthesis
MDNQDLISIIIPCYNSARTITGMLQDILGQSYRPTEIIAVNDGSTDGTLKILNAFSDRIKIFSQPNHGAPAARNFGFSQSRGQYVLFCDADVRLSDKMLEKMHTTLRRSPQAAYCYSNFKFGPHTFDLFPFDPARLRRENYISTMSLLRREAFIGFDENLKRFQDWDLWKRMLDRGLIGVWHPERLFSGPMGGGISKFSWKNIAKLVLNRVKRIRPSG